MLKMWEGESFWEDMQKPEQTGTRDDNRQRAAHDLHQNNEDAEVATQEFDVVR